MKNACSEIAFIHIHFSLRTLITNLPLKWFYMKNTSELKICSDYFKIGLHAMQSHDIEHFQAIESWNLQINAEVLIFLFP